MKFLFRAFAILIVLLLLIKMALVLCRHGRVPRARVDHDTACDARSNSGIFDAACKSMICHRRRFYSTRIFVAGLFLLLCFHISLLAYSYMFRDSLLDGAGLWLLWL